MAVNNRTEADIAVDAVLVPTLTLAAHKTLLKESINSSTVFRKDVISSDTPAVGAVTVSFLSKDLSTITTSGDLVVSFSDIENGDVKYLAITKALTDEITFSGATDVSARRDYIISDITYIIYKVSNKNGTISVNSINIDNDITAEISTEISAWSGGIKSLYIELGDWNMDTQQSKTFDVSSILLLNPDKIIGYSATVKGDVGSGVEGETFQFAEYQSGAGGSILMDRPGGAGTERINLVRTTGGFFDSTDFDAISFNRGWLIVDYIN